MPTLKLFKFSHWLTVRFAGLWLVSAHMLVLVGVSSLHASNTNADECALWVDVSFRESAPRDSFHFTNNAPAGWQISRIMLNLEPSAGRLIFDTESGGKGVEVFQLFKVGNGSAQMADAALPGDGDSMLAMQFDRFSTGDTFSFSIDVDDQLANSSLGQIRVSGSEIAGGLIDILWTDSNGQESTQQWQFNDSSRGQRLGSDC